MARSKNNEKSDNKAVAEKPVKELSLKKMVEAEHLAGKHIGKTDSPEQIESIALNNPDCDLCSRRVVRNEKKAVKRKAFYAANPVYADN